MATDWLIPQNNFIWHIWGKDSLFSAMFKHGNTAMKRMVLNYTFTSCVYKQNMWVTLLNKCINKHEERCQDYCLVYIPALVPFYFNTPVRALSTFIDKFPLKHVEPSAEEKELLYLNIETPNHMTWLQIFLQCFTVEVGHLVRNKDRIQ